jgi:hypothetical protein
MSASETDWQAIVALTRDMAGQGLRVLLVVHYPDSALLDDRVDDARLPTGMTPDQLRGQLL